MSECLIVGGSSVAGQASLAAVRRIYPGWHIAATSSKSADVPGADVTITGMTFLNRELAKRFRTRMAFD